MNEQKIDTTALNIYYDMFRKRLIQTMERSGATEEEILYIRACLLQVKDEIIMENAFAILAENSTTQPPRVSKNS